MEFRIGICSPKYHNLDVEYYATLLPLARTRSQFTDAPPPVSFHIDHTVHLLRRKRHGCSTPQTRSLGHPAIGVVLPSSSLEGCTTPPPALCGLPSTTLVRHRLASLSSSACPLPPTPHHTPLLAALRCCTSVDRSSPPLPASTREEGMTRSRDRRGEDARS